MKQLRTIGGKFSEVYNPVDTDGVDYLRLEENLWYYWNGHAYEPVINGHVIRQLEKSFNKVVG